MAEMFKVNLTGREDVKLAISNQSRISGKIQLITVEFDKEENSYESYAGFDTEHAFLELMMEFG